MSFLQPINCKYSCLSLYYIAYSANNMGKHFVFVIYRNKGNCNSLIFILLLFWLSHQERFQDKTHFVQRFLWYRSFFNQYSYCYDFFCFTTKKWFGVCHRYYYTCLTFLFILICPTGRTVMNHRSFQGTSQFSVYFAQCNHTFK